MTHCESGDYDVNMHPVLLKYGKEFHINCELYYLKRLPSIWSAINDFQDINEITAETPTIEFDLHMLGCNNILYTEEYINYILEYIDKLNEFEKENEKDIKEKNLDMVTEAYKNDYLKEFNEKFMKYMRKKLEESYGNVENKKSGQLPAIDHIFLIANIINFMGFDEMMHMIQQFIVNSVSNTEDGVMGLIKLFNYVDPETGEFMKPFEDQVITPHLKEIKKICKK